MKTNYFTVLASMWLLAATTVSAGLIFDSTTQNGGNPINLTVPDGNTAGIRSTLNVSGVATLPSSGNNVILTLNISGGNNGDLYVYLSYGGQMVVLLDRPGVTGGNLVGYTDAGFNVTLSGGTLGTLGNINTYGSSGYTTSGGQVTGTYNPAAGSTAFQSYNSLDPNGSWILFVADRSGGDLTQSVLNGWSLTLDVVPEPVNVALTVLGLLFAGFQCVRWWRGRNPANQV